VDLGNRLKLFRVAADLKQTELAEQLGVTSNYVYLTESGRREPSQKYLTGFSKAVGVPLSVVLLEPAKTKNAKTRKLMEKMMALMAEYADSIGVEGKKRGA
jgi:transcriptional regulator with XRE-family HTH domain